MSENSAMESVCSTTTTTVDDHQPVAAHPQAGVNPPLSAASLWCFNDVHPYPVVLALPVPNHQEITKLTLFTGSEEDHSTALSLFPCAPKIKDHLQIKNHHRDLGNFTELIHAASCLSLSLFLPTKNRKTQINISPPAAPNKPIKNHRWDLGGEFLLADDELIDAASSLSLSLPTKRKRLIIIGPKKPENNSSSRLTTIQVEDEGVAKKQKVDNKTPPTGQRPAAVENHHHRHWIHKRLSTSDVNLSSRLLLPKEDIRKYVLPLMDMESCRACQNRDGLRVKIWDLDTESQHQLTLKQWKTDSFLLTTNWNTEFVKRRSLQQGDTISMCWEFENLRFLFRKFNA